MKRWTIVAVLGMTVAGLLAGCTSGDGLAAAARLRFLHFSADTPDVLIRRDGVAIGPLSAAADGVLVNGAASPEIGVNPEPARYTGTTLDGTTVFDVERSFDPARIFLALLGQLTPAAGEPPVALREYPYDDTLPSETAGVRLLHAAVGGEAVTLVRIVPFDDETILAEGLAFGEISGLTSGVSTLLPIANPTSSGELEVRDGAGAVLATLRRTFLPGEIVNLALVRGSAGPALVAF